MFYGAVCLPVIIELAQVGDKRGECVICCYVVNKLSFEELKKKYGNLFCTERELPTEMYNVLWDKVKTNDKNERESI